jgi:2-keto-3-deoxy-L-rhamnonate aldolase RhmA
MKKEIPSNKGEALEQVITEGKWPSEKTRRYVTGEKCVDTLFIPMIESVKGVENLDAICSIPGVDALFVGPNDLTTNMGIPNEYDHPDLIAMLQRVIDAGDRRHIAAGCWFGKTEQALRTIRQGARLVVFSNDGVLLQNAIDTAFAQLKKG